MIGRVKYYSKEKGYGFITSKNGENYFYHITDVVDFELIEVGDVVEFVETENNKGKKAIQLKLVEKYNDKPFISNNFITNITNSLQENSYKKNNSHLPNYLQKYDDDDYSARCSADARRNIVNWAR